MEHLKAPIAGDEPFGIYLKGDKPNYRALRNAFNAAQAAWRSLSETQESLENRELAAANSAAWANLAELCETCLKETSKDLEIFTWFTAAQVHGEKPIQNTAAALTAIADLVEESIDSLHPLPPADKLKGDGEQAQAAEIAELRLRPFVQLVGEVEGSGLLAAPMTAHRLIGEVTYGKFILADKNGTLDALRAETSAGLETGYDALTQKVEGLQDMQRQFDRLDTALKKYAAQHSQTAPMIGYGRRLVTDILAAIQRLVEGSNFVWPGVEDEALADEDVPTDTSDAASEPSQAAHGMRGGGMGFDPSANLANRNEALQAVARLATYFRTTEPHSPICLLLDRAVRWGSLSAGDLYREILSEGSVGMAQMSLMTGLESQGFADTFGKRGAGAISHPTLSDYSAAMPKPNLESAAPVAAAAPQSVPVADPAPTVVEPVAEPVSEAEAAASVASDAAEAEPDLPVEDFQW